MRLLALVLLSVVGGRVDKLCKSFQLSLRHRSLAIEGGISEGDPCEAFAYHGYNGSERETADSIKRWVKQGN